MDAVSVLTSALAAGGMVALKEGTDIVVRNAWQALKQHLLEAHPDLDLSGIETHPDAPAERETLALRLAATGAGEDRELLARAMELVELIRRQEPEVAAGIDLADVKAAFLRLDGVQSEGGVVVRRGEFSGGIDIRNVRTGKPPKARGR